MIGRALQIVRARSDREERERYLRNIAEVLAAITMLAGPIYAEYPDLIPPNLRHQDAWPGAPSGDESDRTEHA